MASADVTFLPPDPQTNFSSGSSTSTELKIILKEDQNNTIKTIDINFIGLAEVLD